MNRGRIACVLGVLAGLVVGTAPAASAAEPTQPEGIGVRLLEAPEERRDDPRARIYIVDHVAPGTTVRRRLEVSNSTDDAHPVDVYVGPAGIADGQFVGAEAGATDELVQWTRLSRERIDLGPGERAPLTVTIDVPQDAVAGERLAVVWASVASVADDGASGAVRLVNRVGVRVYLSVGPGGEPASDFTLGGLTAGRDDAGRPFVVAQVRNTGGRALDVAGELLLTGGPASLTAGPFPVASGATLAPGDTAPVTVLLDESLPGGRWHATLDVWSGRVRKQIEGDLTLSSGGIQVAAADPSPPGVPASVLATGSGLVLILLLLVLLLRRRRTSNAPSSIAPTPTSASSAALGGAPDAGSVGWTPPLVDASPSTPATSSAQSAADPVRATMPGAQGS